jgi:glutamine---fructose-6-phosphate transaminase (isomerizing)
VLAYFGVVLGGLAPLDLASLPRSVLGDHLRTHEAAIPNCAPFVAPLLYAIPIQLLAYHTAVVKGTDVDQPRNLAKSVTVE